MSLHDDENDAKFRKEAEELRDRLPTLQKWAKHRNWSGKTTERAFIIEFAGMPKAGKSLAIETVRHFFSHGTKRIKAVTTDDEAKFKEGFSVHTPAEGVSLRTPNYLKPNLWDFNAWAGAYALQELLQARHDRYHDLVLLDRGPWDAGCWLEYVNTYRKEDVRHPDDADKIVEFFKLTQWTTFSDLHVLLTVDPNDAQNRERGQRLIEHEGFASNKDGMERMRGIYQNQFETLRQQKASLCTAIKEPTAIHIDTTNRNPKEIALEIIRTALDLLDAKLANLQSTQPISKAEVIDFLEPYLKLAREKRKQEVLSYLSEFVKQANALSEENRQSVRAQLRDVSNTPLVAASDRDLDKIVRALRQLLRDVENE